MDRISTTHWKLLYFDVLSFDATKVDVSVPLTEARRQRIALDDAENRRTSSRGLIPKAKVKTIKMTFVIIFGKQHQQQQKNITTCCLSIFQNPSYQSHAM